MAEPGERLQGTLQVGITEEELRKVDLSSPDPLMTEAIRLSQQRGGGHYSWYLIEAPLNVDAARNLIRKNDKQE